MVEENAFRHPWQYPLPQKSYCTIPCPGDLISSTELWLMYNLIRSTHMSSPIMAHGMGKASKRTLLDFIITKVRSIVKGFLFIIKGKGLERWGAGGGAPRLPPWGGCEGGIDHSALKL